MERALLDLSTSEFEELIGRVVDRRLEVWLTQLLDAMPDVREEEDAPLRSQFAESLRRSLEQARGEQTVDLQSFRNQLGR